MSTHNKCFRQEIRKILCGYPLLSVAVCHFSILSIQLCLGAIFWGSTFKLSYNEVAENCVRQNMVMA